jgi:hypothetical protein
MSTPLVRPNNLADFPIAGSAVSDSQSNNEPAIAPVDYQHPLHVEQPGNFFDQNEMQAIFEQNMDMAASNTAPFYSSDAFLFKGRLTQIIDYVCFPSGDTSDDYAYSTSTLYHNAMEDLRARGNQETASLMLTEIIAKLSIILEDRREQDAIISAFVRAIAHDFFKDWQHGMDVSHRGIFPDYPTGITTLSVFAQPGAVGLINMLQCLKAFEEVAV